MRNLTSHIHEHSQCSLWDVQPALATWFLMSGSFYLRAGQNLTIGVSEVVEGAVITGSARIVKALVSSLQLGFGLMIGEKVVWWLPKLEPTPCADPNIFPWFLIIW
jgi:hypothetical protein